MSTDDGFDFTDDLGPAKPHRQGAPHKHAKPKHSPDTEERDHSHSYSGLLKEHRAWVRRKIFHGCHMMMSHIYDIHYTEYGPRWSGIQEHRRMSKHQYPRYSDCSSMATWILWNVLHLRFGLPDIVNGANWTAGYTGTIALHGKKIHHDSNIMIGDLILYGPAPTYSHVTVALGHGQCFSHGSEPGPYIMGIDYRDDRAQVRRFI